MEYGKIIAVTGLPGLFELISSKNDGAIVRSLEDKNTKFVSSRVHNFSHLESIEVFTVRENVNLIEIFHSMEQEGSPVPDGKDAGALKKYFEKVYPDLDFERVYTSDLKKMAKWYEVLKVNDVELKLTQPPEEEQTEETPSAETPQAQPEQPEEKAPAKSRKAKPTASGEAATEEATPKTAAKKKPETAAAAEEEKEKPAKAPAKKSAPKKK